jgi:ankyrin repeat protein
MASFLGNFDALNLLIEAGADLGRKNNDKMTSFDEILRNDNIELFECVFEHTKKIKRNMKEVILI